MSKNNNSKETKPLTEKRVREIAKEEIHNYMSESISGRFILVNGKLNAIK